MSARVTKVSDWRMKWMGSVLPLAFLMAAVRASAEETRPSTAMIFWPGASLALSAGPDQRTSEITHSALTRRPREYQTLRPPRRGPPAMAMVRSEALGLSVKTSL